ncbi:hypothetical protein WN51_03888 [Melipona quadrifasciata]|uniref:Uncharacterized protein n=1 Tax=Melipona quadrifasciata TaxID=166423 RepID=A0A0N0U368_9HYME|nr:hypothetical protein WN51_03888 [Melipona quadrifasciata]
MIVSAVEKMHSSADNTVVETARARSRQEEPGWRARSPLSKRTEEVTELQRADRLSGCWKNASFAKETRGHSLAKSRCNCFQKNVNVTSDVKKAVVLPVAGNEGFPSERHTLYATFLADYISDFIITEMKNLL